MRDCRVKALYLLLISEVVTLAILLFLIFAGCAPTKHTISPANLAAWKGMSVSELENRPVFSTIPKTMEGPPGHETWTYSDCQTTYNASSNDNCYWITRTVQRCDKAGEIREAKTCCISKFVIEKGLVVDYSITGVCPSPLPTP